MAMKGLVLTTWLGWWTGIILLKHPWGNPSFSSWFTFSTFYSLFFLVVYMFLGLDLFLNNSTGMYQEDEHKFGRLLRAFSLGQYTWLSLFKRLSFFTNAKKIAKLMKVLNDYPQEGKMNQKKFRISLDSVLIATSSFLVFLITCTRGADFVVKNARRPSYLNVLGVTGYSIVYYMFALIPLSLLANCTFSVILVISQRIVNIFCRFCIEVTRTLPVLADLKPGESHDEILSIIKMGSNQHTRILPKGKCLMLNRNKIKAALPAQLIRTRLRTRHDVMTRFEEMKELMKLANEALSSLTLFMVCSMTLNLVTILSLIAVIGSGNEWNSMGDILVVTVNVIYTYLLGIGHKIGQRQKESKLMLQRAFLSLPWSLGKVEIEDVIQEILEWEWKLTACGFFTVDRRLASGIFTLVLNYIVILVQLNIALMDTSSANYTSPNRTQANFTSNDFT